MPPVYVDSSKTPYRRMLMSHMIGDTLKELHEMADKIGLKRSWFQSESSIPHYDLCQSKRAIAIDLGAQIISNRQLAGMIKDWRLRNASGKTIPDNV